MAVTTNYNNRWIPNHFDGDLYKGIRHHSEITSFLLNILSVIYIGSGTIEYYVDDKKFYLNRKSAIKWIQNFDTTLDNLSDEQLKIIAEIRALINPKNKTDEFRVTNAEGKNDIDENTVEINYDESNDHVDNTIDDADTFSVDEGADTVTIEDNINDDDDDINTEQNKTEEIKTKVFLSNLLDKFEEK